MKIRRSIRATTRPHKREHQHLFDAIGEPWRRRTNRSERRPRYSHALYQTMFCRCGNTKVIVIHP